MYHPFLRGKQFELLALRELAEPISNAKFTPVIEPVKQNLSSLERALNELVKRDASAAVIINPQHGEIQNHNKITEFLEERYGSNPSITPAILLTEKTPVGSVVDAVKHYDDRPLALVHAGFFDAKSLVDHAAVESYKHIFLKARSATVYRRHFRNSSHIVVEDGFERKRNADYSEIDWFSDLHLTFKDMGADGYGDFLTIGDYYSESGGPAYAVAIHLTVIDPRRDNAMFVHHFVSDENDTPDDPAGKFAQALNKLIAALDSSSSFFLETSAVKEFRDLHSRGHFPGLGHLKKLSIKHHVETLADYHSNDKP